MHARGVEGFDVAGVGVGGEAVGDHLHAFHPVDQSVVQLDVKREPAVGQPVDQIGHPQRAVPVQRQAVQVGDQLPQAGFPGLRRQHPPLHMAVQVDVDLLPDPAAERARPDVRALAEPGIDAAEVEQTVAEQVVDVVAVGTGRRGEDEQRGDVHRVGEHVSGHHRRVQRGHRSLGGHRRRVVLPDRSRPHNSANPVRNCPWCQGPDPENRISRGRWAVDEPPAGYRESNFAEFFWRIPC